VQRQFYPLVLLSCVALAIVVCLRPSAAQELSAMAASEMSNYDMAPDPLTKPLKMNVPSAPSSPIATVRPVNWPAAQETPFFSRKAAVGAEQVPNSKRQGTSYVYPTTDTPHAMPPAGDQLVRRISPPSPTGQPAQKYNQPIPKYGQPAQVYAQPAPKYGQSAQQYARPTPKHRQPHQKYTQPAPKHEPTAPELTTAKPCEGVRIVARIGNSIILEREAMGVVNAILEANKDRIPKEHLEKQRKVLFREALKQHIDNKLVYEDAIRSLPEEAIPEIEKQINRNFEEKQITAMMKRANVNSRHELNEKLKKQQSSLDIEKRAFMERSLAMQWVRQKIDLEQEITHEQRLVYYRENLSDFEHPAKVKWEQLSAHFDKYPSIEEARAALAKMGNQVIDGVPFEEVARVGSNGSTSKQGGKFDWTQKNSLKSDALNKALFSLPIGQLSPMLEDERGIHIVRVLKRNEKTRTPFIKAQSEIQEKIRRETLNHRKDEYLARLRKELPVWTIFDGPEQDRSDPDQPKVAKR